MNYDNIILTSAAKRKLKDAGVAVVYFFGSRAAKTNFTFSDIDIGIVLEKDLLKSGNIQKIYNCIYDILSSEILHELNAPKLDISFLQKSNPILAMKAIQEGKILFESSGKLRADFEEATFIRYDDYSMLQREYEDANLKAFENPVEK